MSATVHGFQTEVTKLLNLLAHSLYSNKEIFLRELISNASDAIDKLHFMSLTEPDLIKDDPNFKIRVRADKESKTLTITDNGIGMTLEEANKNLGTIAKSGTEDFIKSLSDDAAKSSNLIGQFGVGFYSAFVVAKRVTVLSRSCRATPEEGVRWTSDGSGTYEIENTTVEKRGTQIILELKDEESSYLDNWVVRNIIQKFSDHISTPVELYERVFDENDTSDSSEEKEEKPPVYEYEQINKGQALWTRPAKEISDEEYKEFYKNTFMDYSEPLSWTHNKVEGEMDYTSLLYLPSHTMPGMLNAEKVHNIKLYVQRVFIMDDAEQFLPRHLRFVSGLVDTNMLQLNVSRELLQENKVTRKLKSSLTKRAYSLIEKLSEDKEQYKKFTVAFNDILKEGINESQNRDKLLKLIRFASTYDNSQSCVVSLDDYVSRMKENQNEIYYISADEYNGAADSPLLERFKEKGLEVLLFWKQPIDMWFTSYLTEFEGKKFVSITSSNLDLSAFETEEEKEKNAQIEKDSSDLVSRFKTALGSDVEDVRVSTRVSSVPSCAVPGVGQNIPLQIRLAAKMQGTELPDTSYILELNPEHELVKKAYAVENETEFADWARLLYLQALMCAEGGLKNPHEFVSLVDKLLAK